MELEERVRALEDEVKVLKNEIKHTLLDIREQVLLRAHPALRAEEAPSSPSPSQAMETIGQHYQAVQVPAVPVAAVQPGPGLRPQRPDAGQEPSFWPRMPTPGPISPEEEKRSPSAYKGLIEPALIAGLAGWATASVKRVGREYTKKVVEIFAQTGHLMPEVRDMLLQLASLSDEDSPAREVRLNDMLVTLLKLGQLLGKGIDAGVLLTLLGEQGLG